jgi:predicted ribosome quality control (RQC) complex YloA/Tae2 family protein
MVSSNVDFSQDSLYLYKKAIKNALKHLRRKLEKQRAELEESERALWYRQIGDSLLANPKAVPRGLASANILNIHIQKEETVALNPKFDAKGNAELFYKKARRAERGGQINSKKVAETENDISAGETLLTMTDQIQQEQEVDPWCERMTEYIKKHAPNEAASLKPTDKKDEPRIPFRHFTIDEWDIYIGKNDAQNDELTTRFAKLSDLWLHVAGHPGSHVVIRKPDKTMQVPQEILQKAASLAVWFSRAKHTSYAEVHYTETRFVRKRRHSPPGEVMLDRYKSIRVSPKSPHDLFPSRYEVEEDD